MNTSDLENTFSLGVVPKRDIVITRGKGARLWDENEREYIDCVGGQGTANIGHCHEAAVKAVSEQMSSLSVCPEVFHNDVRAHLLAELASLAPGNIDQTFLCNSGAEAVEAALKFARVTTGRTETVAAMRGFHGRTMGALSATWNEKYRKPFQPLVPGFSHVKYNDVEAMAAAVTSDTAAVILEIVQGEGGVRVGDADYLRKTQEICRSNGALFIVDEVQTGFGRTGKMFAVEHHDLQPDILCVAKAMAAGLPMGATLCSSVSVTVPAMSHGTTFGGNPVLCAASLATLGVLKDEDLACRAMESGEYFRRKLSELESSMFRDIRGLGLLIGVELKGKVTPILKGLMERGVLALPAGNTVLRFLPPLVISRSEIDTVIAALAETLNSLKK